MSHAADADTHFLASDSYACGGVEEAAEDLFRLSVFEADETAGEVTVQSVGQEGEHDVQIDLNSNGRTEGIEVKEVSAMECGF